MIKTTVVTYLILLIFSCNLYAKDCISYNKNNLCITLPNKKTNSIKYNPDYSIKTMIVESILKLENASTNIKERNLLKFEHIKELKDKEHVKQWNRYIKSYINKEIKQKNDEITELIINKNNVNMDLKDLLRLLKKDILDVHIDLSKSAKIDLNLHEKYVDRIWDYVKPPVINYENKTIKDVDSAPFFPFTSQRVVDRNYIEPKTYEEMVSREMANNFHGFAEELNDYFFYKNKKGLIDAFNKKIPESLNETLKDDKVRKAVSLFLEESLANSDNAMKKFKYNNWQLKVINNTHLKFNRKIYLFKDKYLPKTSPFVDPAIGNLYLSEDDYFYLKENGLLKHLMLHEASHVSKNIINYENQLKNQINKLAIKSNTICAKMFDKQCENKLKKAIGNIDIDFIVNKVSHMDELIIDLHAIQNLDENNKKRYLSMLKHFLPHEYKSRISIIKKYINLSEKIRHLKLSKERLRYSFFLYKINLSDNLVTDIHNALYSIKKFKHQKFLLYLQNTFNLDFFYKSYKDFEKINNILKSTDTDKDLEQYMQLENI